MFQPLCHVFLKSSVMTQRVDHEGGGGAGPLPVLTEGRPAEEAPPGLRTPCRPGSALRPLFWCRSAAGCAVVLAMCLSVEALPGTSYVRLPGAGVRL